MAKIELTAQQREGLEAVIDRLRKVLWLCPDGDVTFEADEFIQGAVLGGCIETPRRKVSSDEENKFRQSLVDNGTLFAVTRLFQDLDPDTASGYDEHVKPPGAQVWQCYNYVSELIQPWNRWRAAKAQSEDGHAPTSIAVFLTADEETRRATAFQKIRQKVDFLASVLEPLKQETGISQPNIEIHRRAHKVFEWWLQKYPEINNGHQWLRPVICSSETAERIREQCWFDDLFEFLVPLGLLLSRSVVELSTTVEPYSMRVVVDWSNKPWREATKEALIQNNLLPDHWPDFDQIKASICHYGVSDTSILGAARHKQMKAAPTIEEAVQQLVETSAGIGFKNNLLYAEIKGIRVLGPENIKDTFPPIDGPLLPTPYVLPEHLQATAKTADANRTQGFTKKELCELTGYTDGAVNQRLKALAITTPGGGRPRKGDKPFSKEQVERLLQSIIADDGAQQFNKDKCLKALKTL